MVPKMKVMNNMFGCIFNFLQSFLHSQKLLRLVSLRIIPPQQSKPIRFSNIHENHAFTLYIFCSTVFFSYLLLKYYLLNSSGTFQCWATTFCIGFLIFDSCRFVLQEKSWPYTRCWWHRKVISWSCCQVPPLLNFV